MNIAQYVQYVRNKAANPDASIFYNSGPAHAQTVFRELIPSARSEIKMITGAMDSKVFEPEMFKDAAGYGVKFKIVIDNPDALEVSSKKDIPDYLVSKYGLPDNSEFKIAGVDCEIGVDFHLTVVDTQSFRFEDDKDGHQAIISFGNQELGKHLSNVFDSYWKNM